MYCKLRFHSVTYFIRDRKYFLYNWVPACVLWWKLPWSQVLCCSGHLESLTRSLTGLGPRTLKTVLFFFHFLHRNWNGVFISRNKYKYEFSIELVTSCGTYYRYCSLFIWIINNRFLLYRRTLIYFIQWTYFLLLNTSTLTYLMFKCTGNNKNISNLMFPS